MKAKRTLLVDRIANVRAYQGLSHQGRRSAPRKTHELRDGAAGRASRQLQPRPRELDLPAALRAGRSGRGAFAHATGTGGLRRDRRVLHQRAEPARRRVHRGRDAGRPDPSWLHLRAPQLRPERGDFGGVCRRPRRLHARDRAGGAVRARHGLGRAPRAVAPVGGDRPHDERHLHRRVRRRRPLDDRRLGGVLLRVSPSLALAFVAGLLSFLSPCVLPLIPSYVGFLTGLSLEEIEVRRGTTLAHALWFVAGFSLIFIALGATASALGVLLLRSREWIGRIGGIVVILFGLYLLGVLRPAFLMRARRLELARKPIGYLGSAFVGVTFGAAWTPCIGPILGAILTLAAAQGSVWLGTALLGAYALGLAIPFVGTALALDRFLSWFQRFRPYLGWVDRIAGALLVVLGILLVTDRFTLLAGWLQGLTPQFLKSRL